MAASEARFACQRVANCCFIQEEKTSRLAGCLSSSATLLSENASPTETANRPDDPATKFMHISWNPSNPHLQPGARWWVQLRCGFPQRKNIAYEEPNALEAELKQMKIGDADPEAKFLRTTSPCGGDLERNTYSSLGLNRKVPASCIKHGSDARLQEYMRLVKKQKHQPFKPNMDVDEYRCWDEELMDAKLGDEWGLDETRLIGRERIEGWRLAMERNELHDFAALTLTEKINNCDLPQPKTIYVDKTTINCLENRDHSEIISTASDQKIHSKLFGLTSNALTNVKHLSSNEMGNSLYDSKRFYSNNSTSSIAIKDSTGTEASKLTLLMEALCHSQTRARLAEKAAQQAYIEKDHVVTLFFQQAHHLFACKQWLQVLQQENSLLQLKLDAAKEDHCRPSQNLQWKGRYQKMKRRKLGKVKYSMAENVVSAMVGLSLVGTGMILGWNLGWLLPLL